MTNPRRPTEYVALDEWLPWLQNLSVPAAIAPFIIALVPRYGGSHWLMHASAPRQRDIVLAEIDKRKHPAWRQATLASAPLQSIEAALTHVLARPFLDTPRICHLPSDFIVQALTDEVGANTIGDALIRGDAPAIARIELWLRIPHSAAHEADDSQVTP